MSSKRGAKPVLPSVEAEVIGNILAQPLGPGTVADLNLPREFVQRYADRVIRASFYERSRIVVADGSDAAVAREAPVAAETVAEGRGEVLLARHELSSMLCGGEHELVEGRPGQRGYACPIDVQRG